MTSHPLRILVVEDHFLARFALVKFLGEATDMLVVAVAETGQQAVELYRSHNPDMVVMDLRMPEMDGVTAIKAIRAIRSDARILVVSHYENTEDVGQALQAGARGFIKKDASGQTLLNAIRRVGMGLTYVPADLAISLAEVRQEEDLTVREREVLEHMFAGQINKDIALALGITEGTVRIHVSNILHKLGASRRTEAVTIALKRGLLRS